MKFENSGVAMRLGLEDLIMLLFDSVLSIPARLRKRVIYLLVFLTQQDAYLVYINKCVLWKQLSIYLGPLTEFLVDELFEAFSHSAELNPDPNAGNIIFFFFTFHSLQNNT